MKGLEALESIIETFYNKDAEDIQIVRKELKALEIIKNKKVDVWCFTRDCMNLTYKQFLESRGLDTITSYTVLTSEEYDLLKEVLR